MKKTLMAVLIGLLFIFVSCSSANDLENAFDKMETVDSYRMDMKMTNVPFVGSMSITVKQDGDMTYSSNPLLTEGLYQKTIDGEVYDYILQEDGSYELSTTPSSDEEEDLEYVDSLDYNDFSETDDMTWTMKTDRIYLDENESEYMENVVITLNNQGYFDTINFSVTTEGLTLDVEITFTDYNNTTVELPTNN